MPCLAAEAVMGGPWLPMSDPTVPEAATTNTTAPISSGAPARGRVVILGAGPAGLGAAYHLARKGGVAVTVIERNSVVGGNAGSFEIAGLRVDYGSHRLHPACDAKVLEDIRNLLGEDLLDRPRHGRIRLQGRWIHFPLKPVDLLLRLPPAFALRVARDIALGPLQAMAGRMNRREAAGASFSSILSGSLGPTIAGDFYIPYARKIWGLDPDELDPMQARRRVSANSPAKLLRKVLSSVPGLKAAGAGRFFYPRGGFGRISESYAEAALAAGADLFLGAAVKEIHCENDGSFTVVSDHAGRLREHHAEQVWSTIPISVLAEVFRPRPPAEVLAAGAAIESRAMLLVYLVLDQDRFSEYDAHYFPEPDVAVTRISEPKNYSDTDKPVGRTVLCAELPCSKESPEWKATDEDLAGIVRGALESAGLPLRSPILEVAVRRLPQAYPIYRQGYEKHFARLDGWSRSVHNLVSFGRQGLFAHDNTHHALFMAYCACECLGADAQFDEQRWNGYRKLFESHVVED